MDNEPFNASDTREWRRMQAWRLKQLGWQQRDIAVARGAPEGAVSPWPAAGRAGGPGPLLPRPAPGHPAQPGAEQRRLLPDFLGRGTGAHGFRGEAWTCARVAQVLEEEFGVSYRKSQVSHILKELRWTPQVPITRASQRDEEAIERWRVAVWPGLREQA